MFSYIILRKSIWIFSHRFKYKDTKTITYHLAWLCPFLLCSLFLSHSTNTVKMGTITQQKSKLMFWSESFWLWSSRNSAAETWTRHRKFKHMQLQKGETGKSGNNNVEKTHLSLQLHNVHWSWKTTLWFMGCRNLQYLASSSKDVHPEKGARSYIRRW